MPRIYIHLADLSACGFYRVIAPARHCKSDLADEGIELVMSDSLQGQGKFDTYIFPRYVKPEFFPQIMKLKRRGAKIYWSIDDDLWNIPEWSPAYMKDEATKEIMNIITEFVADKIIVTTDNLAIATGYKEKCVVCPNLMNMPDWPKEYRQPNPRKHPHNSEVIRIVWTGSETHEKDLDQIIDPMGEILRRYPGKVEFVFFGYISAEILRRYFSPQCFMIFPIDMPHYPEALASLAGDIALCPLLPNAFNSSKSNIKILETILASMAPVVSKYGPYGTTLLPLSLQVPIEGGDWVKPVCELIEDAKYRKDVICEARTEVEEAWTWQSKSKDLWLDMFRKSVSHA